MGISDTCTAVTIVQSTHNVFNTASIVQQLLLYKVHTMYLTLQAKSC